MKAIAIALLSGSLVAQTVWTVNSAGGAQFAAIQAAITAAVPGDRIVVTGGGPYATFVVDRGVEIEGNGTGVAAIEIAGVPAGQRAQVRGFAVIQDNNGWVSVHDCGGDVQLGAIDLAGLSYQVPSSAHPGLEVRHCNNVIVRDSRFLGHAAGSGAPGVFVDGANAVLIACHATGGVSVGSSPSVGNFGRPGIEIANGGQVTIVDTDVDGGPSASASVVGGDGGDGLAAWGGTAHVLGGCNLRGKPGSFGSFQYGVHGAAARGNVRYTPDTTLVGPLSGIVTGIAARPVMRAPATVAIGGNLTWTLTGAAGQLVVPAFDLASQQVPLPALDGTLVLTPNAALAAALLLDAAGAGSVVLSIPNLPALRHLDVFGQAAAFTAGALVLTAPSVTHVL